MKMRCLFAILSLFCATLIGCKKQKPPVQPPQPPPVVTNPDVPVPPVPSLTNDRVLLVGINAYPNGAELNGCINDVVDVKQFFTTRLGFKESQIKILSDANATTTNILEALNWLVADAKAGDRRYFHYSGHGAEYVNPDAVDQPNHANQIICPVDFDWSPSHMIMDVQLAALFVKFPAGVKFNWVSDSCNSGDLTRTMFKPKMRIRQYPIAPPQVVDLALKKVKKASRGMVSGVLDVGFISGCKFDETSADAFINGRYNGAFTYYFLKVLDADLDKPLTVVVKNVNEQLRLSSFDQTPQAEGARVDLPLLK